VVSVQDRPSGRFCADTLVVPSSLLTVRREALGLSKAEVAHRAGISLAALAYIEGGQTKRPIRRTIYALADVLLLDWQDLEDAFFGDGES
jgi:transcriptional regulator with XRE-family HTH domain